jgi:hypothetical protein
LYGVDGRAARTVAETEDFAEVWRVAVAVVGGAVRPTDSARPRPVQLPAAEVESGDWVRDEGRFRRVSSVQARVADGLILLCFDPEPGCREDVGVPVHVMVSVWRVSCAA